MWGFAANITNRRMDSIVKSAQKSVRHQGLASAAVELSEENRGWKKNGRTTSPRIHHHRTAILTARPFLHIQQQMHP